MDLPSELIDLIFSFLSSNPTLSSCSQVCSAWTGIARRRLFHKLVYVRRERDIPDVPALLRFLQDSPSVAEHIRILDLTGGMDQMPEYSASIEPEVFLGLLRVLPNVEDVKLGIATLAGYGSRMEEHEDDDGVCDVDFTSIDEKAEVIVGSGRRLKSLQIGRTAIEGANACFTLLQFLRTIESLDTLHVFSLSSRADKKRIVSIRDYCSTLALPSRLGIQKFVCSFQSAVSVVFMETIRLAPPHTLRHLDLSYSTTPYFENKTWYIQDCLNHVGAGLDTLSLFLTGNQSE